jgi:hypothetical protein
VHIDPAYIAPGFYTVGLQAVNEFYTSTTSLSLKIVDEFSDQNDSDGDGILDRYDAISERYVLQGTDNTSQGWLLSVEPEFQLALGPYAFRAGTQSASVAVQTIEALQTNAGTGEYRISAASAQQSDKDVFDIQVSGLMFAGQTVEVIVPQSEPLPAHAEYQHYSAATGWSVPQGGSMLLKSAPGEPGICPAANDSSYVDGLRAGYHCVQVSLSDGGSMDTDGMTNGVIYHTGGVLQSIAAGQTSGSDSGDNGATSRGASVAQSSSAGGGGLLDSAFVMIMLLSLLYAQRRSSRRG